MAQLNLSPAWDIYYQKVKALFGQDPEIAVVYDRDNLEIKLYVDNAEKAEAIDSIIIHEASFGSNVVKVTVIPCNSGTRIHHSCGKYLLREETVYDRAFYRNPLYSTCKVIYGIYNNPLVYVVFAPVVVQFYTDSLNDYYGMQSTLAQVIAKDILKEQDQVVFYCTDRVE